MSNTFLLIFILLDAFLGFSVATADPPAAAPTSSNEISGQSQPRKLGNFKHQAAPSYSPIAEEINYSGVVEGHGILLKKHHHGVDKSVAGGGVILGGLATTFLVAIFCYIRATARHKADSSSTTT